MPKPVFFGCVTGAHTTLSLFCFARDGHSNMSIAADESALPKEALQATVVEPMIAEIYSDRADDVPEC